MDKDGLCATIYKKLTKYQLGSVSHVRMSCCRLGGIIAASDQVLN